MTTSCWFLETAGWFLGTSGSFPETSHSSLETNCWSLETTDWFPETSDWSSEMSGSYCEIFSRHPNPGDSPARERNTSRRKRLGALEGRNADADLLKTGRGWCDKSINHG
jgi:hypothetical protein